MLEFPSEIVHSEQESDQVDAKAVKVEGFTCHWQHFIPSLLTTVQCGPKITLQRTI